MILSGGDVNKKGILLLLSMMLIITGCSTLQQEPYSRLLSKEEGSYSLVIVGHEQSIDFQALENYDINKRVTTIINEHSLELFNRDDSALNVQKAPAFLVFDTEKEVFRSYDFEELIRFLQEE